MSTANKKTMSSGTKWGIATIVFGVVAFAGIMIFFSKKAKAAAGGSKGGLTPAPGTGGNVPTSNTGGSGYMPTTTTTKPATVFTGSFPLKYGSRDTGTTAYPVKRLQWAMQGLGRKEIVADGIFGPKTEAALVAITGKKTVASEQELAAIEARQYQSPAPAPFYDILGLGKLLG